MIQAMPPTMYSQICPTHPHLPKHHKANTQQSQRYANTRQSKHKANPNQAQTNIQPEPKQTKPKPPEANPTEANTKKNVCSRWKNIHL
jgi:hypothetical protein